MANYAVTRTTGITFNSIASTGNAFSAWRNSTTNLTDDNRSFAVNFGFDFWYLGARYTQVSASTNGFVDLSSSTADGNTVNPYRENPLYLSQAGGTLLAMAPFYEDLWTSNGGNTTLSNSIKYELNGAAPYRVFTIEFIAMDNFTAPNNSDLNFQVKFYETTGIIEFIYGTMTAGTSSHSYGCGINASSMSATPAASQLLEQQTANTASFNNIPKYNLSVIPASNSKITFTPPTSAAPTGLSFTSVTKTSMMLNWVDNSNNELGFIVSNSTDGINFNFVSLVAANTFNTNITGLIAGTTYFWNINSVTEGKISTSLSGSQSTLAGGTYTSLPLTGNWNNAGSWTGPGGTPGLGDNVIISNGSKITIDVNAQCNNLTIGQGSSGILQIGNNGTARNLTILGNITVGNGAIFKANSSSAATHILNFSGNLINSGTVDFSPSATNLCNVTFLKNGNQNISGTGISTRFNKITLNMGLLNSNILEISVSNFSAASGFLTLTNGTFKISTGATLNVFNTNSNIPLNAGLIVNHPSATVNTTGGNIILYGSVGVNNGVLNIGNAANNNLTSNGGSYNQSGGIVTIAGRFDRVAANDLTFFNLSGGLLIVADKGSSTASLAPFHITEVGSVFNMSDGTILIRRSGAGNLGYLNTIPSGTITGGTVQIGDAMTPVSQIMQITTTLPVNNLTINSANATGRLFTNSIVVLKDVIISNGVLDANSLNISLGGNWNNNSALADPFLQGTGTVTFNGEIQQNISSATTQESFYNLTIENRGINVSLINNTDINISNILSLTSGIINADSEFVILSNTSSTGLVYNDGFINGNFRRYLASNIDTYLFPVGCGNSPLDKHNISLMNNLLTGVSYLDASVVNFSQSAPNNDASIITSQFSTFISETVGASSGQTLIWTLTPNAQPSSGTYGVQLSLANSNLSAADDNSFCPLKRSLMTSFANFLSYDLTTTIPAFGQPGRVYNSGNGYAQRTGYTSFSQFAIGKYPAPLPIKLISFDAKPDHNKVNLTWTTSVEINNEYFTIERSSDGINFEEIEKIQGAGNSSIHKKYSTIDYMPINGVSYYRLKQTDYDGQSESFNIVSVEMSEEQSVNLNLQVSPNIFNESFTARFESSGNEIVCIQIINMNGSVMHAEKILTEKGNNKFLFTDSEKLISGTYILRLINRNEIVATTKIICNK